MKVLMSLNPDLARFCPPFDGVQVEIFVEVTETNVPIAAAKAWTDGEVYCIAVGRVYLRDTGQVFGCAVCRMQVIKI